MAMVLEEPLVQQQQKRLLKGTKRKHLSEEPETGLFGTLHDCTVLRASSIPNGHMDIPTAVKRPKLKIKFGGAPVKTILEKQVDRRTQVAGYGVEVREKLTIEIPGLTAPSTDRLHDEARRTPVGKSVRAHEPLQAPAAERNPSEGGAKQLQGRPPASQSYSPPQRPAGQDQNVCGSRTGSAAAAPHRHAAAEAAAAKEEPQASGRAQQAEQPEAPAPQQPAQLPPEPMNEPQRPAPVLQHKAPVGHQEAAAQAKGLAHGEPDNAPAERPGEQASVGIAATDEQPTPKHVAAAPEEREPGETSRSASSSHSSSSSSSSSSSGSSDSSDSESNRHRSRRSGRRRRPQMRSREPGEHSDGERQGGRRHSIRSYSRSRSRSPSSTADRGYHADGFHWRDRYERRRGERAKRFSRDRGERRSERGYNRPNRDMDLRSSPDDRREGGRSRRSSGARSRAPAPAASQERTPRAPSRLGDPNKAVRRGEWAKQPGHAGVPEEHGPAARPDLAYLKSGAAEQRESLPCNSLASEPAAFGFADAWNLLQGCDQNDVVGESELDELHAQAVKAKHAVTAVAKGQNGRFTLENLVALMRDSYLVFLQFCAAWEAALLQPTQNPRRTRAKLADENGFYPGTINLMHQLARDAASCPANSVACKVLRLLAERLVGIMHVRVLTVQRYKIQQDRKLLLACPDAPRVDIYGRRQPGPADIPPGETFQRPSPTDSNASNSTGELAVSPGLANRPSTAGTPPPGKPAGKPAAGKPAAKAKAGSLAEARAAKAAGRPEQAVRRSTPLHTPQHTPPREEAPRGKPAAASVPAKKPVPPPRSGRDDAWQVEPPAWQIPHTLFESEMRSWTVIGGVTSAAAHSRAHCEEIASLMRVASPDVREAAGMLGFLDLGIGASNIGIVLQLSRKVLQLVLKIAAVNPPIMEAG